MQASDVMKSNVVTVGLGHSVRHAVLTMIEHNISGLPVIDDDGKLAGLITEGDLLRRAELGDETLHTADRAERDAGAYVKSRSWRVSDVMSATPVSIPEDAQLSDIAAIMLAKGIKRLPVVRDGRVVGIVSRSDLLGAIVEHEADDTAPGDEAIARAVNTRLHADLGLSPTGTGATVEDRHVVLWGNVADAAEREAARVTAEGVRGVTGVTNKMTVGDKGA
ncbi:CBS domain-containing protein [Rhizobium sp. RAF56]|jgi:CBS domain-containing protein|uniref:CBS domain-containing protein n=1 Tax=Rhizobium sp. RAF56 TaxID=3233062 RepID=UPI003F9712BC